MIAALVLGRKGSVGMPGKNLFPVFGRPLAWYPMHAATQAAHVDRIYLSTDDEQLMEIARGLDIEIIERPEYLCNSAALGEAAYGHGYKEICKRLGEKPEMMVLLFCNAAPLLPCPRTICIVQFGRGVSMVMACWNRLFRWRVSRKIS